MPACRLAIPTPGRSWEEMPKGWQFRTEARTVTEADLVSFVNLAGILEPLFVDAREQPQFVGGDEEAHPGGRRLVPGAMTYAFAEGLVLQTLTLHRTGIAFLGCQLNPVAPVFVGDTIDVEVEVTESRATSRPGHGVVVTHNKVFNQKSQVVFEYTPARLVTSRDAL